MKWDVLQLHEATPDDLPGLVAIYNDVMAGSTAIFSQQPATLEERWQWWQTRIAQGYPVLIARDALGVAGFATFGDFRSGPATALLSSIRYMCAPTAAAGGWARGS